MNHLFLKREVAMARTFMACLLHTVPSSQPAMAALNILWRKKATTFLAAASFRWSSLHEGLLKT